MVAGKDLQLKYKKRSRRKMQHIKTHKIHPVHMRVGDTLGLTYTYEEPEGTWNKKYLTLDKVDENMVVDTIIVYKVENEYGLKGVGRALILGEDDGTHKDVAPTKTYDVANMQVDRVIEGKMP